MLRSSSSSSEFDEIVANVGVYWAGKLYVGVGVRFGDGRFDMTMDLLRRIVGDVLFVCPL
jgi:hypothetical protein